jgi:hypothetical protein
MPKVPSPPIQNLRKKIKLKNFERFKDQKHRLFETQREEYMHTVSESVREGGEFNFPMQMNSFSLT